MLPILIGLQMHDLDVYREFKNGHSPEVMINILTSSGVPKCDFLIMPNETFSTTGNEAALRVGITHVEMRDRLQAAYNALFSQTERVKVGQMTFSDHTREYLYEAESILISDNKFDFE